VDGSISIGSRNFEEIVSNGAADSYKCLEWTKSFELIVICWIDVGKASV